MNAKKAESKKTVTITIDGEAQRSLVKACRALSEVAAASITVTDHGRSPKRS